MTSTYYIENLNHHYRCYISDLNDPIFYNSLYQLNKYYKKLGYIPNNHREYIIETVKSLFQDLYPKSYEDKKIYDLINEFIKDSNIEHCCGKENSYMIKNLYLNIIREILKMLFNESLIIKEKLLIDDNKLDVYINHYQNNIETLNPNQIIDVVFVSHIRDIITLELAIDGIREHGKNIRRIIVVSSEKLTNKAEWFNELLFPFTKKDLMFEIFGDDRNEINRIGWIYQQLLKLYSAYIIPEISSNVLVIDSDTIFIKDVEFIDNKSNCLFNTGIEYHYPYFEHASKLIPGFKRVYDQFSGICHHMLFQKNILDDLFLVVENYHKIPMWKAVCKCINHDHVNGSSFSEYEIYFNFVFSKNYKVKIRNFIWTNIKYNKDILNQNKDFDYISCHYYL